MSVTEIALVAAHRPTADATTDQVAAWYQEKGRLHEHLAAAETDSAAAAAELAYAAAAYEHARRLAAEISSQPAYAAAVVLPMPRVESLEPAGAVA